MTQRTPDQRQSVPQDSREAQSQDNTMDPADPSTWPDEFGGQAGPEPTRYGDWEKGGRCTDF
ncbi:succinate dehydrogenase assembly factor 4 [Aquisalimonas sp.]|uniref:DUF1674 domain-containing protein n=1 Tax=Aquisalimonas sp. TaxID=1872621 RepID=UPI0025C19F8D|nr:succinate dehydrogenase assembly factor 4 [Aquisalimonas sp.]